MFFGPIVSLEMVTGSRRARYFIVRVLYAAVLFVLLWVNYMESSSYRNVTAQGTMSIKEVAQFSNQFFAAFAIVQMIAVLLLTPAMIAGSIAQERERRTIEYMFASTLTGSEIVLSKFLARTVHVASLLVVGLPILAIAMSLGGIDPQLLLLVFLVTVTTLVALASLSIAVSVWAKRSRDAVVRTYILLLVFLALPPLAWAMSSSGVLWDLPQLVLGWFGVASLVNPFYLLTMFFSHNYSPNGYVASVWQPVWPFLIIATAFITITLGWATISVRRVYRKSIGAGEAAPRRGRFLRRWRPRLGERPMLWKELFASTAALNLGLLGRIGTALLFLGATAPAFMIFWHAVTSYQGQRGGRSELVEISFFVVTMLECGALLVVAIRAAGSITAEKERDSWLSLVSTPLEPREIVWAKIAGSIYAARWFALPIGVWWLLGVLLTPTYLIVVPLLTASFLVVAVAVAGVGVWNSSWCRTSIRAMASTVATMAFVGGGYLLCCMPLMVQTSGDEGIFFLAPCIPFLLAAPAILWVQIVTNSVGLEFANICCSLFLGTIGYMFLGWATVRANIVDFDHRVGRPMRTGSAPISSMPSDAGAAS